MPYAHFQISGHGGEPEERLNGFLGSHRILKVEKHFVAAGSESYWAYQVEYGESASAGDKPGAARKLVDYKELLSEADFGFFLRLREWRKARAEAEAVDAFNVFTNAQLAAIAERRPASLEALKAIPGVGQGRMEKYGEALVKLVTDAT